jgi:hypothetical protein
MKIFFEKFFEIEIIFSSLLPKNCGTRRLSSELAAVAGTLSFQKRLSRKKNFVLQFFR